MGDGAAHTWRGIVRNPTAAWLAAWREPLSGNQKFIFPQPPPGAIRRVPLFDDEAAQNPKKAKRKSEDVDVRPHKLYYKNIKFTPIQR